MQVSRRIGRDSPLEPLVELNRLEKKISTIEISLEKIGDVLKSPPSYAEKLQLTSSTNATKFQWSRYPQEQTLFIIGDISRDLVSSSMQQKTINQLFPYTKLDYCFAIKTGKIALLYNAEDCSKSFHRLEVQFFLGNSTNAVYHESSNKKLHCIALKMFQLSFRIM